jgi:hypothetical protein
MTYTAPDITLAMITALKADADVAAIVGTRVYRKRLPDNPTFPAIAVSVVSDIDDDDTSTSEYAHASTQCSCFATTDGPADALSKTVRKALHRKKNTLLTAGTDKIWVISVRDTGVVPDENTDISVYMYHRSFSVHYSNR